MRRSFAASTKSFVTAMSSGLGVGSYWVGTAPPMAGLLRLVCAIPLTEPGVPLSWHPALH